MIFALLASSGCNDKIEQGDEEIKEGTPSNPTFNHDCPLRQEQGSDSPETHIIEMFVTSTPPTRFNFSWETFSIKDQIVVFYDNEIILDTGCVGENNSQQIELDGESTEIRVEVNPNCDGTTETQWNFTVDCPMCDFGSTDNDPQRCFGGIGARCKNDVSFAPKTYNYDRCEVNGFMSAGSIEHDRCCLTNPAGANCQEFELSFVSDGDVCGREWNEAWYNSQCSGLGASRQWPVTFGTYKFANQGDFDSQGNFSGQHALNIPAGQKINPAYQHLCFSGYCRSESAGFDACGNFCTCE